MKILAILLNKFVCVPLSESQLKVFIGKQSVLHTNQNKSVLTWSGDGSWKYMNLGEMKYVKNGDKYIMYNSPSMIAAAKYQGWNGLDMQLRWEK
jgi:hypothetical protein